MVTYTNEEVRRLVNDWDDVVKISSKMSHK